MQLNEVGLLSQATKRDNSTIEKKEGGKKMLCVRVVNSGLIYRSM